jgi:hypothetical protein
VFLIFIHVPSLNLLLFSTPACLSQIFHFPLFFRDFLPKSAPPLPFNIPVPSSRNVSLFYTPPGFPLFILTIFAQHSCFSYHVFSHVILFNCGYEVTLVVPLPPLGCVFNLHTRPLFKFAFIFNTCMSQPNFPFSAVIFYRRIFSSDSPDGLVVIPISFLASILNVFTPLVW